MYRLIHGRSEELLKTIPECIVDSIVTDPPYHLTSIVKRFGKPDSAPAQHGKDGAFARASRGFMGKEWDGGDIAQQPEFWAEVLRVLKPGGHLIAFSGSRTYHRMACAIEDAGFEIRDQLQWVYGSGFPKSHDQGNGWGTALKPAHEPIVLARKPLDGTVADNMLRWRTGAINIDGCRVAEQGRWPANFIHDGSDEVVAGFPQSSVTGKRSASSKAAEVSGTNWLPENHESTEYTDAGSVARFFYCAKTSKADREEGLENFKLTTVGDGRPVAIDNAYQRGKTERRNTHPTVKPTKLMRYLCRLVTPLGGLVLDPFMGSGSTGKAAILEGFNFIGMEMESEYIAIAKSRIERS